MIIDIFKVNDMIFNNNNNNNDNNNNSNNNDMYQSMES